MVGDGNAERRVCIACERVSDAASMREHAGDARDRDFGVDVGLKKKKGDSRWFTAYEKYRIIQILVNTYNYCLNSFGIIKAHILSLIA